MKLLNIFKWRVRLVQKGYDLGWQHGFEAGKIERQDEIIGLLTEQLDGIDWLKEEPVRAKDIIPMVKDFTMDKEPIGWN